MFQLATKEKIACTASAGFMMGSTIWLNVRNSLAPSMREDSTIARSMGGLLVDVIKRQDNNMVQALVILYSIMGILGLLLGDIAMGIVDPRISFTKKGDSR